MNGGTGKQAEDPRALPGCEKDSMHGYYLSFAKPMGGRYRYRLGRPLSPKDVKKREAYHKAGRFIAASELEKTINEIKTLAGLYAEALLGRPNCEIYRGSREDIAAAEALINRGDIDAVSKKVGTLITKRRKRVEKIAKALMKLERQARKDIGSPLRRTCFSPGKNRLPRLSSGG